jgi:type II secretory ATPase GspE/PulE/Tfp pilus assembly ATPase PilB-like protein
LPLNVFKSVITRIKYMCHMKINLRDIAQDGTFEVNMETEKGSKKIDTRVSIIPGNFGESAVIRLLDPESIRVTIDKLGLEGLANEIIQKQIQAPNGMILNTGPTGSGKTTTIYAAISSMRTEDKNIMTIENPIEYEIKGIVQSQIDVNAGVTFANTIRAILRQDPDIIYVGEIRDLETAEIAVQAALTGHLVLSTLHANSAIGAITRLKDIGIESGLISDVLKCSFAQRLVRKICTQCKGTGCSLCSYIGFRGRIGIYEIMHVNRDIRHLITNKASGDKIRDAARISGMKSLYEDGMLKVQEGITTVEEVQKVINRDEISE